MSNILLTVMGFAVIILFMFLVIREVVNVQFAFILLPITAALICGFSLTQIRDWILAGLQANAYMVGLIVFIIPFFLVMNHAGVFDGIIDFVTRKFSRSTVLICVAGWVVATLSSLDGVAASTVLVTASTMLPIYKKARIRPIVLGFEMACVMASMGAFPWSGNNLAISAALGTSTHDVFLLIFPAIIVGYITGFLLTLALAAREERRIKNGLNDYLLVETDGIRRANAEYTPRQLKMRPLNLTLVAVLLICFFTGLVDSVVICMICCSIAFLLNYPNAAEQQKALRSFAPMALVVAGLFMGAGCYTQIMQGTGMMDAVVDTLLNLVPSCLADIMYLILSFISIPLAFFMGSEPVVYGIMPVVANISASSGGITMLQAHAAYISAYSGEILCCATAPSMYLMLDMLGGIKLKDFGKFSLGWLWGIGCLMLIITLVTSHFF